MHRSARLAEHRNAEERAVTAGLLHVHELVVAILEHVQDLDDAHSRRALVGPQLVAAQRRDLVLEPAGLVHRSYANPRGAPVIPSPAGQAAASTSSTQRR